MYRDKKSIKLIPYNEPKKLTDEKLLLKYEAKFIQNYINKNKIGNDKIITIGFENYNKVKKLNPDKKHPWPCEIIFYKQFKIPFKKRFKECYWKRDKLSEKKLFNKMIKKNEKYIFVHDDPSRNIFLKNTYFDKSIKKIVRNNIKENIFNYGQILENANEIHIMESSIRQILEVLNIKTKKLFLYKGRGGEHDVELFNKKLNKFVGTRIKWHVIRDCILKKNRITNKIVNKINYLSGRANQKIIYYKSIKKFS
tara:strand:- start:682 stop:1440 length:759 start_codon:yes stop_codon:yes gene_type:complete